MLRHDIEQPLQYGIIWEKNMYIIAYVCALNKSGRI